MAYKRKWYALYLWDVIALAWLALVFLFSSQPYEKQSIKPLLYKYMANERVMSLIPDISFTYRGRVIDAQADPYRFVEFLFRKGAHLFMYGTLAALVFMVVYSRMKNRTALPIAAALLSALSVASLDEWNQLRGYNRTGSVWDIGIDMVGATVGVIVCSALIKLAYFARKRKQLIDAQKRLI